MIFDRDQYWSDILHLCEGKEWILHLEICPRIDGSADSVNWAAISGALIGEGGGGKEKKSA